MKIQISKVFDIRDVVLYRRVEEVIYSVEDPDLVGFI
jgi:hypothetical protein